MFETNLMDRFTFTAGLLYPMEFMPTECTEPSADYVSMALSELYAGLTYSSKYIKARVGADFISLVPRWRTTDLTVP